eukprot:1161104-Pelagomonas_calceolata.AAC.2
MSTTIYRPVTPDELDHRPLSRQESVQCVQGTDTSTAVDTKQQFLGTYPLRSRGMCVGRESTQRQPQPLHLLPRSVTLASSFQVRAQERKATQKERKKRWQRKLSLYQLRKKRHIGPKEL